MNNSHERFRLLMQRYFEKTATEEEREAFFQMLRSAEHDEALSSFITTMWEGYELPADLAGAGDGREALEKILEHTGEPGKAPVRRLHVLRTGWFRYAAAAAVLLAVAAWFWTAGRREAPAIAGKGMQVETDIAPGKNGAVLTLADGRQVELDSLASGVIATQGGAQVKLENGVLAYDPAGAVPAEAVYNTMSTPRGRQFRLTLPDGSRVWLNAASSVRYPAAFSGKERRVEIHGEAYFEVVKNAAMPFTVKIDDANEVAVLGTSFNISAYGNGEAIKTTLAEGAVRVSAYNRSETLKPGQQAVVSVSKQLSVHNADLEKAMAWKNGLFNFEGLSLKEIMNQLERWYNIEVVYQGPVKDIDFYGKIDRNANLGSIIKVLKAYGVNCRLEGRQLIMLP